MSLTNLIDDLAEQSELLRAALQSGNAAHIEAATDAFRSALDQVKAVERWPADMDLRGKVAALRPKLDESRALSCLLADMTGQMHEIVAAQAPASHQPLHSRPGDRFA